MKRRVFNILTALSLVLSLVVLFAWLHTHSGTEGIVRIQSHWPLVSFYDVRASHAGQVDVPAWRIYLVSTEESLDLYRNDLASFPSVRVAYWVPFVMLLVPPIVYQRYLQILRHRRQSRLAKGQCLTCGYNLTGNVSGVCPECGTAVPPKATGSTLG